MKRFQLLILFLSLSFCATYAQDYDVDLDYVLEKNYAGWKKGAKVHLTKVRHKMEAGSSLAMTTASQQAAKTNNGIVSDSYFLIEEGSNEEHAVKSRFDGAMRCQYKSVQDIWDDNIIGNVLVMIQKKTTQTMLREEMEEDALKYINSLENSGYSFNDPYLESYLYSLVSKIAPKELIDGRPGNVNLILMSNQIPNAFTFANGTIVVTTGLLSALHTEDEIVAILSHEIAHFVLDHSIQNVNAAIKRQQRAEFWAAMATIAAAVGEGVAASKNSYYVPGSVTYATAVMASEISSQVIDRLGMKYNNEQEFEADELAVQVLKFLGYDTNALATALYRLQMLEEGERSHSAYFKSFTHPALVERIAKTGKPNDKRDPQFEKMISFATTSTAIKKYDNRRYRQVLPLVQQNIDNHVATADDYILKANCLIALRNDPQSNAEVLSAINIAKSLNSNNINIYKAEIIASLRLKKKAEAQKLLLEYISRLDQMSKSMEEIRSATTWDYTNNFIVAETTWADNMTIKLKGM